MKTKIEEHGFENDKYYSVTVKGVFIGHVITRVEAEEMRDKAIRDFE